MKILVVSQYFWPEDFRINDICKGLKEEGHEVTVLTGLPNYPFGKLYDGYSFFNRGEKEYEGIKIKRCAMIPRGKDNAAMLALNYISFIIIPKDILRQNDKSLIDFTQLFDIMH